MKFAPNVCPECEQPAKSSIGSVLVDELMSFDEDSETYEYCDDSDVDWNCQSSDVDAVGRVLLCCPDGHQWRTDHLDRDESELAAVALKLGKVQITTEMDKEHARLFLLQRRALSKVLEKVESEFTHDEVELLIGLQNLCDHIADCLSDQGFPHALMSRIDNPDLAGLNDDEFDSLTDEQIRAIHLSKSAA